MREAMEPSASDIELAKSATGGWMQAGEPEVNEALIASVAEAIHAARPRVMQPTEDEFMGWLDRAYNHPGNDGRNFTRWNMRVAFNAGIAWAKGRVE